MAVSFSGDSCRCLLVVGRKPGGVDNSWRCSILIVLEHRRDVPAKEKSGKGLVPCQSKEEKIRL